MKITHIGGRPSHSDYLLHSHECSELLYITAGEGKVEFGNKVYPLVQGDIVFLPPNTVHTGPGGDDCGLIYIIADTPASCRFAEPFIVRDTDQENILSYFKHIHSLYKHPDTKTYHRNIENILCDLIFELVYHLKIAEDTDREVAVLRDRIATGFFEPHFSLGHEMRKICPSVTYLRRRFVRKIGISPGAYLTAVRIDRAKRLIEGKREKNITFTEIAAECGFTDEHYFFRVFKKECGMTPGEYYRHII